MSYEDHRNTLKLLKKLKPLQAEYKQLFNLFSRKVHDLMLDTPARTINFVTFDKEGFFETNKIFSDEELNELKRFEIIKIENQYNLHRLIAKPLEFRDNKANQVDFESNKIFNFKTILQNSLLMLIKSMNDKRDIQKVLELFFYNDKLYCKDEICCVQMYQPTIKDFAIYQHKFENETKQKIYNIKQFLLHFDYLIQVKEDYMKITKLLSNSKPCKAL